MQISGKQAQQLVHKWRSEEQAIMVGTRTALYDNPRLNTRHWSGKNPTRIVIDKNLQLPETHYLFDKSTSTIVYTYKQQEGQENLYFVKLQEQQPILTQIMQDLHSRNILSVMVEGGTYLHESLLKENLWDEAMVFKNRNLCIGSGIKAPAMVSSQLTEVQTIGSDLLFNYRNSLQLL